MKKMFATTKARVITAVITLSIVLVGAFVAATAYYGSHALPGAQVSGHSVGGQTRQSVAQTIKDLQQAQRVVLEDPDGNESDVDFAKAGLFLDIPGAVDAVFAPNADVFERIAGLLGTEDVTPRVIKNVATLDDYLADAAGSERVDALDATVSFDESAGQFSVTEGAQGRGADYALLRQDMIDAAASLDDAKIQVTVVATEPSYSTESAEQAADVANGWLGVPVEADSGEDDPVVAGPAVVASWVDFKPGADGLEASIDNDAVLRWVNNVADSAHRDVVNGVRMVDSSGKVVHVRTEGSSGRDVTNQKELADGIISSIEAGTPYVAKFDYSYTEPTFEDKTVAPGTESLAYWAAPGEKWIDVNLSRNMVTAYSGSDVYMTIPMVHGYPETPTLVGDFAVYAKIPIQDMAGRNADGSPYLVRDVPWVLFYDGDYGLHGAPWYTEFGPGATGGSHGCTNMPVPLAKQLFEWAEYGTPVIVHN